MDEQDFEDTIAAIYPRIRRAALLLCQGNVWDADDLAQETLLQAADGWSRFRGHSRVETWLYAILMNQHRRRRRSAQRILRRWLGWLENRGQQANREAPDAGLLATEWKAELWDAVSKLPEAQRETVVLRFAEGLSYEDIAQVLKCPLGTVKSRLHLALGALEKGLKQHVRK
ncbi:MAG: RNA polymerase sigma factor [Planctomycetes bacterium]|nr:RNA polymerase sigma factor [Planctomycetota bacterium]